MHTDKMVELNPEEMEAAVGGLWEEIGEFGKKLWDKVKNVLRNKLKDYG